LDASKKRKATHSLDAAWGRQVQAHNTTIDLVAWKAQFIQWTVRSGISLREAAAKYHNELLAFQNLRIEGILPTSHNTVASWILQAFEEAKPKVAQVLAKATSSKLTISFDGWTANSKVLDLLGIICHYLDENNTRRAVVLGLRDTLGSHTGANMADHLLSVLQDYKLSKQVTYFMADNATNNDKALAVLSGYLPSMKLDPVKHRLRCSGHIYNLVCKAILYGVDSDCLEDASQASQSMTKVSSFEAVINGGDDESKLTAWRKKGPVGKLHNTVIQIKGSSSSRLLFESKQRQSFVADDEDSEVVKLYRVVVNGGIRWNSTYLMIDRAMRLKEALHLYQDDHHSNSDLADYLTAEDWRELADLKDLLMPVYDASMKVQTHDTGLHEVLTSMDFILTHLEAAKDKITTTDASYFKACVNLSWQKLDQYYTKTDLSPAYIIAVFLHPQYKLGWFKRHWGIDEYYKAIACVEEQYNLLKNEIGATAEVSTSARARALQPSRELTAYEQYNRLSSPTEDEDDDLQRYKSAKIEKFGTDPL
jgi:hypothetical protein